MTVAFSVCVFCGSKNGDDPVYAEAARAVGHWIAQRHGQLVFGGGSSGLMGVVAEACKAAGGRVVGIIPRALVEKEWAFRAGDELHIVETMHERKALMAERADVFLTLPGGIGTFEEFFEVWTWRQLGYHDKPIGLLNVAGYYDALLDFMASTVRRDFLVPWQMQLIETGTEVDALLPALINAAGKSSQTLDLSDV